MAQAFPTAIGFNQLSGGNFIPEIWTTLTLKRYYEIALTPQLVNFDYEGEIKNMGDKVNIRRDPEVQISAYYAGMKLERQNVVDELVEFVIDHGAYFNIPINKVQRAQADINFQSKLQENATKQHKRYVDQQYLGAVYADAAAANIIANTTITPNNLPNVIVAARTCLQNQNAPEEGRWLVLPYWMEQYFLLNPQFISAEKMGDSESIIKAGKVGRLYNFDIYSSPNLAISGGYTQVIFGCKTAVTFATQITEAEEVTNPDDFGTLIRGLQVFAWKTVQSTHIGKIGVAQG